MCIIVVKQRGSDFCPLPIIKNCFNANPHGFAFSWNQGGELKTFRTLDMQEALDKYKELSTTLNRDETAMIVHARIKSHGSVSLKNCHAFVHGDIAFSHNGILDIKERDDMTDSEIFFRELFCPVLDSMGMDFALKMARMFIGSTNNKFSFIDKDGRLWFTSGTQSFLKQKFDGYKGVIYFSNSSYMSRSAFASLVPDAYAGVNKSSASSKGKQIVSYGMSAQRRQVSPPTALPVRRDSGGSSISESLWDEYTQRYAELTGR